MTQSQEFQETEIVMENNYFNKMFLQQKMSRTEFEVLC